MTSDTRSGSVGPGGYVAAIKAAQLGLRVHFQLSCLSLSKLVRFLGGRRHVSRNEVLLVELA